METAINFTFLWSVRLKHRFKPVKPHLRIPSGHAKITGKSCMYLSIRTVRLRVCRSVYICLWLECYVLDLTTSKFWALIERYISDMIYSYCSRHNYQQVHETKCKIHLVKFCISISNHIEYVLVSVNLRSFVVRRDSALQQVVIFQASKIGLLIGITQVKL